MNKKEKNINNDNKEDEINTDALIEELKNIDNIDYQNENLSVEKSKPIKKIIDDNNLSEFIYSSAEELITTALDTVKMLKGTVTRALDYKELTAFADLIKATSGAMETLNSINLQKQKFESTKELKIMDIEAKKANPKKELPSQQTNNILITGNREEILKLKDKFLKHSENVIDAVVDEEKEEKETSNNSDNIDII